LYYALTGLGNMHSAASHLARALQLKAVISLPWHGAGSPVSVLLLLSINAGNVLIQRFLNDRIFQTHIVIVEFYEGWMPLPPHDLVINGVGDADVRAEALSAAASILARTSAPVINNPAAVRETGRCRNAERLAGIPGLVTARTMTLPRTSLTGGDATAELATHGFEFPLLLRAPGFHMGKHFVCVERASDLADELARLPGDDFIVLQYLDGRGADGYIRKYRVLFIDGGCYPVHAAVSSDWKIHYFSAEMAEHSERRAEDAAFLADMEGVLGADIMTALERVQEMLGLDYGGIDFGLNRKGEILLFEANATMAVYWPEAGPRWEYRRPAVERIYTAVQQMLMSRASVATWPGPAKQGV
jgi:glutathione synthase/RimK-type ligase-like ATP-grasp enzyme